MSILNHNECRLIGFKAGQFLLMLALVVLAGPPDPDFTGLKRGNRWVFTSGTTAVVDKVDSTEEGWKYRKISMEKCPYCKDKLPMADTAWALVRGDSVFQAGPETNGRWELSIVLPPKAGLRWVQDSVERDTMQWINKSSIRVQAGTFSNCWRSRSSDSLDVWIDKTAGLIKLRQGSLNVELQSFQRGE